MAMPQRKPLSVMVGLMAGKKKPGEAEPDGDEGDEEGSDYEPDEAELAACQDVIDAVQKRDPRDLSAAFHHWLELAGYGKHESEEG